jgi:LGFP repeat
LGSPRPESLHARQTPAPRSEGWWQAFDRGWIYWHPNYGAQLVRGKIFEKWGELQWEQGTLGFPKSGESQCREPDGADRYQIFEGGRIYWRASTNQAFAFKSPTNIGDNGKCVPPGEAMRVAERRVPATPPDSSIVRRTRPQALKVWLSTTVRDGVLTGMGCENSYRGSAAQGNYNVVTRWENLADPNRPAIFDYDTRFWRLACRNAPMIERVEGINAVSFGPRAGNSDRAPIESVLSVNMDGAFADNTPYTVFAVVERYNGNNNNYFFSTWPGGTETDDARVALGWKWDRMLTLDQWGDRVELAAASHGSGNPVRSVVVAAGDGQSLLVSLDEKGQNKSAVKMQGVRPLRHTFGVAIGAGRTVIGLADALAFFEGNVYEIIVYNERLKQSEIDEIKDNLIRRFVKPEN